MMYGKIEIIKSSYSKSLFFTGTMTVLGNGFVKIDTDHDETVMFRNEQVEQATKMRKRDEDDEDPY